MTIQQFLAWVTIAQQVIAASIGTEQTIAAWITSIHGTQLTEGELNSIVAIVVSNATTRKAMAIADASAPPTS